MPLFGGPRLPPPDAAPTARTWHRDTVPQNLSSLLASIIGTQRQLAEGQRLLRAEVAALRRSSGALTNIAAPAGGECTFVAFRHVEKTGGTAVRQWMLSLDESGRAAYQGQSNFVKYKGRCPRWQECCDPADDRPVDQCRMMPLKTARKAMLDALETRSGRRASLTLQEHHWPDSGAGAPRGPLTFIDLMPQFRRLPCRVVLATVLRAPSTLYPSLQLHQFGAMWSSDKRRFANLTACDYPGFIAAFPNFQTFRLTSKQWVPPPLRHMPHVRAYREGLRTLKQLDVVGDTEHLNDWLELLCEKAGIKPCGGPLPRTNEHKLGKLTYRCPKPGDLRNAVLNHASADLRLHQYATRRLQDDLAAARGSGGAAPAYTGPRMLPAPVPAPAAATATGGASAGGASAGGAHLAEKPQCSLMIFLHMEKTGGSSVVKLLTEYEKRGELQFFNQACGWWQFVGQYMEQYRREMGKKHGRAGARQRRLGHQMPQDWKLDKTFTDRKAPCLPTAPDWRRQRLAVQFHGLVPLMYFHDEILPMLADLRALYASAGCKLVVFTILREPVAREISFYRHFRDGIGVSLDEWFAHDCTARLCSEYPTWRERLKRGEVQPEGFWGRDNAQSRALLGWPDVQPRFSATQAQNGERGDNAANAAWCGPAVQAEAAAVLAQVDIVGTIESFDASLLLLWEAIGVPPHLGNALGVSKVLAQTYDADKAKWKVPNLPAATKAKFDLYTKCDAAAYAVAVRRMAAQVAAADGGGGGFAARLAKMRAEAKESGVVPLPEHPIRWKPGVLCGAPQGYIGPDNLAVYTPRRYDPVCNMTQVVVGVSGSAI